MDRTKDFLGETIVIFYAAEECHWEAHGLRTDQVGCGKSPLEALTDAMRAIDQVFALAKDDISVAPLREAPKEIQDMAR